MLKKNNSLQDFKMKLPQLSHSLTYSSIDSEDKTEKKLYLIFGDENGSKIFLSDVYSATDNELLNDHKIDVVINACYVDLRGKYSERSDIEYKKIIIRDNCSDFMKILNDVLPFIRDKILQKKNVLVHCLEGKSRSVCLVIAYLIKYLKKFDVQEEIYSLFVMPFVKSGFSKKLCNALNFVYSIKKDIDPNIHFLEQIDSNIE